MDTMIGRDLFRRQAHIDGRWLDAESGAVLPVFNPADGSLLGTVPDMGAAETRAAVEAADTAFKALRRTTHGERAGWLEAWHGAMMAHLEPLARIITLEQGKPLAEARAEIRYSAGFVKWFAEEARRIAGSSVPSPTADRRILLLKEPIGVTGVLTPWNFPSAMITRKVAPAIAAGCSVVVKPSELTPFSALALAVLAAEAGIPPGVFNVVTGQPGPIGDELTSNPAVRKISFTGSTRVGALLMRQASGTIKKLGLELGGNAPFIVFDDADLDRAVDGVMASKFRNGGQTCVCANRILVQAGVYDAFAEKLVARVAGLKVGPGLEAGVDIGPMINEAAIEKIERHVADALDKGATVLARAAATPPGRRYVAPIVLGGATTDMLLAGEETFGPVAPLFRFETDEEAIAIANATPYGLAAYFYTESLKRSWAVAEALEFGMVGLNTGAISTEVAPFGGVKQSGLGREGGQLGIEDFLEVKSLHVGGLV